PRPPPSPLVPYTTLCRSRLAAHDQLSAGSEAEIVPTADAHAGPVRVEGRDVARRAAARRHHEHVRALAVLPFRPVAGEEMVDDRSGEHTAELQSRPDPVC